MEITLKKNSTQLLIVDPREFGDPNVNWDDVLTNSVVTFSLFDVETGCFVIASGEAQIIPGGLSANDASLGESIACGDNTDVTRIAYKLRSRDTKRTGVYHGTFQVNVIGEETVLAVPVLGDIQLIIVESGIQPWNQNVYTGLPELLTEVPTGSTPSYTGTPLIPALWADLNVLRINGTLVPGQQYVVIDYQTVHRIPGKKTISMGQYEPLIIEAVSPTKFSAIVKSTLYPDDIIHYEFTNEFVLCEDSFDVDYTQAGATCVNDKSVHRPGYIEYREDKNLGRSSYYDFRAFINSIGSTTGYTFSNETNGSIDRDSGNIIIKSGNNIKIGQNSQSILLTKVANRITIGSDVREFNTSGFTINDEILPSSIFELNGSGVDGYSRSLLRFPSQLSSTAKAIGFLPSNCMVSGLEVVSQGLNASADARISMGIESIADDEIFPSVSLKSVASGLYTAQVSTRSLNGNSFSNATITGNVYGGNIYFKTIFTNTGNGISAIIPTPSGSTSVTV